MLFIRAKKIKTKKPETTQVLTNSSMNEQTVVYLHNGVLLYTVQQYE